MEKIGTRFLDQSHNEVKLKESNPGLILHSIENCSNALFHWICLKRNKKIVKLSMVSFFFYKRETKTSFLLPFESEVKSEGLRFDSS